MDTNDYKHKCKYCGAKPFVSGPHHAKTCRRNQSNVVLDSEEANRYKCRHCGVKPFIAGPHHKKDCPRHEDSRFCQTYPSGYSGGNWDLYKMDKNREVHEHMRDMLDRFKKNH